MSRNSKKGARGTQQVRSEKLTETRSPKAAQVSLRVEGGVTVFEQESDVI